jgi:hypothetical protein
MPRNAIRSPTFVVAEDARLHTRRAWVRPTGLWGGATLGQKFCHRTERLAAWYVGVAPYECFGASILESTWLEPYVSQLLTGTVYGSFPDDWKFWDPVVDRASPEDAYHGGLSDSYSVVGTPCRNVVAHEPLVAMLGSLPDLFDKFLLLQGHAPGECKAVVSRVRKRLFAHLQRRWLAFQRLVRARALSRPDAAIMPDILGQASRDGALPDGWLVGRRRTSRVCRGQFSALGE